MPIGDMHARKGNEKTETSGIGEIENRKNTK